MPSFIVMDDMPPAVSEGTEARGVMVVEQADNASMANAARTGREAPDMVDNIRKSPCLIEYAYSYAPTHVGTVTEFKP